MTLHALLAKAGLTERDVFVWLFLPYRETAEGLYSEYYDNPHTRAEMAAAFQNLGLDWHWTPITKENLQETVEKIASASGGRLPIVFNYCDGDDVNGYPGLSVVRLLEEKGIAFTGADAAFYHTSTSKMLIKEAFIRAGVPAAPYALITDPRSDAPGTCERLGAPLFVKPVISGGSYGLTWQSVVHTDEELIAQAERLFEGMHGYEFREGGVLAEPFILGTEFTVLVVGSPEWPESAVIYPPLEIVFYDSLPEEKHHFVYDMWFEEWYDTRLAQPDMHERLSAIGWKAYCAVNARGYGRVDMRLDKRTGEVFALEVNANCSISSPENDNSSVASILKGSGIPFHQLIGEILTDGLRRYFSRQSAIRNPQSAIPNS